MNVSFDWIVRETMRVLKSGDFLSPLRESAMVERWWRGSRPRHWVNKRYVKRDHDREKKNCRKKSVGEQNCDSISREMMHDKNAQKENTYDNESIRYRLKENCSRSDLRFRFYFYNVCSSTAHTHIVFTRRLKIGKKLLSTIRRCWVCVYFNVAQSNNNRTTSKWEHKKMNSS